MAVLVTMVWLEHPVTAYQDLLDNTVRSISTNVCQAHALMEVAVWTKTTAFIACVLQEQEGTFANRVCKRIHTFHHPSISMITANALSLSK